MKHIARHRIAWQQSCQRHFYSGGRRGTGQVYKYIFPCPWSVSYFMVFVVCVWWRLAIRTLFKCWTPYLHQTVDTEKDNWRARIERRNFGAAVTYPSGLMVAAASHRDLWPLGLCLSNWPVPRRTSRHAGANRFLPVNGGRCQKKKRKRIQCWECICSCWFTKYIRFECRKGLSNRNVHWILGGLHVFVFSNLPSINIGWDHMGTWLRSWIRRADHRWHHLKERRRHWVMLDCILISIFI